MSLPILVALVHRVLLPARRDERGLSQSTESAILLAGAVAVAITLVTIITAYVNGKLAGLA